MIKYFCDKCGDELGENNKALPHNLRISLPVEEGLIYVFTLLVTIDTGNNKRAHRSTDICKECALSAIGLLKRGEASSNWDAPKWLLALKSSNLEEESIEGDIQTSEILDKRYTYTHWLKDVKKSIPTTESMYTIALPMKSKLLEESYRWVEQWFLEVPASAWVFTYSVYYNLYKGYFFTERAELIIETFSKDVLEEVIQEAQALTSEYLQKNIGGKNE